MLQSIRRTLFGLAAIAMLAGCASGPNQRDSGSRENDAANLYDAQSDVLFATEFPVKSTQEAMVRGEQALAQGKTDLALYMYVRAYDLDETNVASLMRIGQINASKNNVPAAMLAYTKILKLQPEHAVALQSVGLLYLEQKQYDNAEGYLSSAVALEPALWRAQNGIGVVADMRGDHVTALSAYDAALAVRPDDAMVLNNRGYSLYMDGKYAEASVDFSKAATSGSKRAYINLGIVLARQGEYAEAVKVMSRATKREIALNDVGYIAMRRGDEATAENYFEKAIQLSPTYFEAAQENLRQLKSGEEIIKDTGTVAATLDLDSIDTAGSERQ